MRAHYKVRPKRDVLNCLRMDMEKHTRNSFGCTFPCREVEWRIVSANQEPMPKFRDDGMMDTTSVHNR